MNNETKHTAGEWTIVRPDYETINIVAEKEFICEIPNYINEGEESEKRGKQAEANARLIAAAPELLEALKLSYAMMVIDNNYTGRNVLITMREALQKAIHG